MCDVEIIEQNQTKVQSAICSQREVFAILQGAIEFNKIFCPVAEP